MQLARRSLLHLLWIATAVRVLAPSAADPDLWGHLVFGGILLGGVLPTTNAFSYTAGAHPWVNHEILAEASMALAYRFWGGIGLIALKAALGGATLAILYRTAERRSRTVWAAAVATALAAITMLCGLMIRPQLFTLLFLALTLYVLARSHHRAEGAAWLLPLVNVVWINTHGGVLAGVGLATLALAAGALRPPHVPTGSSPSARRGARVRQLGRTALLVALMAGALLVNPYGIRLPLFLATEVTPRVPITEWAHVPLADLSFPLFKILLVALAPWLVLQRRVRLPEIVVLVATAAVALLHQRHVPLFAIAAAPLVAAMLADTERRLRRRADLHRVRRLAAASLAVVAVLQVALAAGSAWRDGSRIDVDPSVYPVQALRFLAQNRIGGRVALPFDWGEVALWSLPAGSTVAIDGRFTTAYPQDVLEEAWRFMQGGPSWDDLLTHHATDVVISARQQPPSWLLLRDTGWEYVYSDPVAVVFVRRGSAAAAKLERLRGGEMHVDQSPLARDFPALARGADTLLPRQGTSSATVASAWTDS
ncbi:MAG TPA: hypothetical protein VGK30_20845 [Candidatus Binatia bacterium]